MLKCFRCWFTWLCVRVTKVVGMDCEMVGVGDDGKESILARVSIVNQYGCCIYDKFVRPTERVTDYRTKVSGVRWTDLMNGILTVLTFFMLLRMVLEALCYWFFQSLYAYICARMNAFSGWLAISFWFCLNCFSSLHTAGQFGFPQEILSRIIWSGCFSGWMTFLSPS